MRNLIFAFMFIVASALPARAVPIVAKEGRFQKLGVTLDEWAESQVGFWKRVYSEFDSDEWVVHDSMNPARIYGRFPDQRSALAGREGIARDLKHIGTTGRIGIADLTLGQRRLHELFGSIDDPRVYRYAADPGRLRVQSGRKDRVEEAFGLSRGYLKRMREMFREEGVPEELVLLPFVESAFNHEARSHAGATGIWQFMPKTAARDLRVSAPIDERYDPLKSTRAAARFLKRNHELLGSWALAIMAYHHGAGLVQKAIRSLGTRDPVRIIRIFKDPSFRFASRNYLFEFLAMCDVHAERGGVPPSELPPYLTIRFPKAVRFSQILAHYRLDAGTLRRLNPHFRDPIWSDRAPIPAHYPVRMAGITLEEFRKLQYP
jgi:membrane-bound lytic murein transglycosylase D